MAIPAEEEPQQTNAINPFECLLTMDITNLNKDRKNRRKNSSLDMSTMVYGKVPPQAKDLEEAVLGAIMLEKTAFDTVIEILKPQCFYVDAHQRIFNCMQVCSKKTSP